MKLPIANPEARHKLMQRLATTCRVPRHVLLEEDKDPVIPELLSLDTINQMLGDTHYFYPVSFHPGSFSLFFNRSKLDKYSIFKVYQEGSSMVEDHPRYMMALTLLPEGSVWLMYKSQQEYKGEGAIYLPNPGDLPYIMEPIGNYISSKLGTEEIYE